MKQIAFDLGASSGKVMLGEFDGTCLTTEVIHRFPNRQICVSDHLYWNFLGIYQNLTEGIRKGCAAAGGTPVSIGIDAYCNDFGLIGRNGDLITQVRCYRDLRMARNEAEIYRIMSRRELHFQNGNQNALFNTLIQLAAMRLEGDGFLLDQCETLLHIPDLLTYFLTGQRHSEYTLASVSQMFRWETSDWNPEILSRFEIPAKLLAPIIMPGTVAGEMTKATAEEIGVPRMKVTAVGGHDTASAVAAIPTNEPHAAYISSGTWSLMGVEIPKPIINEQTYRYNIAIEGGVGGRYRMLKNVMGLWLIQECRLKYRKMGMEYEFAELVDLARREKPFVSLIDPDDEAFYMPGDMLRKIRDYCTGTGQPAPETPGQFIRVIEDSLALKYRWVMETLEKILGYRIKSIYILGGGGKDTLLNQLTANACGRTVYVGPQEAALTGNFLMQLKAAGAIGNLEQGREVIARSTQIGVYEPQEQRAWDEAYEYFLTLLPRSE